MECCSFCSSIKLFSYLICDILSALIIAISYFFTILFQEFINKTVFHSNKSRFNSGDYIFYDANTIFQILSRFTFINILIKFFNYKGYKRTCYFLFSKKTNTTYNISLYYHDISLVWLSHYMDTGSVSVLGYSFDIMVKDNHHYNFKCTYHNFMLNKRNHI